MAPEGRTPGASKAREAAGVDSTLRTDDFDYAIPDELIAQTPLPERDSSRLMVLPRSDGDARHHFFRDLPRLLSRDDLLVVNDARVTPARLRCRKEGSGGRVDVLLVEPLEKTSWRAMVGSSKPVRAGSRLLFDDPARRGDDPATDLGGPMEVEEVEGDGFVRLSFGLCHEELQRLLDGGAGEVPLPPYIRRGAGARAGMDDKERYQTIFAEKPGAAAAPTAGLHFTGEILSALAREGVRVAPITLMVGPGTFLPVRADRIDRHVMHSERFEIPETTVRAIEMVRSSGGRVVAVGTTALRALEGAADEAGRVRAGGGRTDLFVRPGYSFRAVDGLLTNFHLPRSTLLMLVSALGGRERVLDAYRRAVEMRYRFFSYGDAMLII